MKTVSELLKECSFLKRRDAEDLVADFFGWSRLELYLHFDQPITQNERQECLERARRFEQGEPLAYLSGRVEFYGCRIRTTPAALIPRPETEILVDKIAGYLKGRELAGQVLWDLCCGTGCIGIALKKRFPLLKVVLADISESALELARENCRMNQVEVVSVQGNLLQPLEGQQADYCVCNPPYLSEQEYRVLGKEVKGYEPELALLGGEQGTEFYAVLAGQLPAHLCSGGALWLELGYTQGDAVAALFSRPPWKNQRLEKDWAGHHRFFFVEKE